MNSQSKSGYVITNLEGNQTKDKSQVLSSKQTRSNLEAFWLWPVMAIMASMQPGSGQIIYARSDFGSVFRKKAWIILCKTVPDPIWMAWSGFGQVHLVWKQASVQESSDSIMAEHNWPLPVSYFQTQLHSSTDSPDHTVQNTAWLQFSSG